MNAVLMFCLVLAAAYGLASLLLSVLVAISWRLGLARMQLTSDAALLIRLLPAGGGALLTLAVVLPAFLLYEPAHEGEAAGPVLIALALVAFISAAAGLARGWRACRAATSLVRGSGAVDRWSAADGLQVELVDMPGPVVAVVGARRPRIVASRRVFAACDAEEFHQIVAHEAAHVSSRDNLKLLLQLISPDTLAWLPGGAAIAARWRAAAEFEADERATGADPRKRLALASALIKVARLSAGADRGHLAASMAVARDDVDGRVRRLLAPSIPVAPAGLGRRLLLCALLVSALAMPLYDHVHRCIEVLVAFGR